MQESRNPKIALVIQNEGALKFLFCAVFLADMI